MAETFKADDGTEYELAPIQSAPKAKPRSGDTKPVAPKKGPTFKADDGEYELVRDTSVQPDGTPYPTLTAPKRTIGDFFSEAYDRATSMAGTGEIGAFARGLEDLFNLDDRMQQVELGLSPEDRETFRDQSRAKAVRDVRSTWAALDEADPAWREDGNIFGNVARWTAGLLGDTVGNANASYLIGGGSTLARRAGVQGGVNASIDAGLQGLEMSEDIRDEFDPVQTAVQFLAGAGLQAGGEAVAKGIGKVMGRDAQPDFNSDDFAREEIVGDLNPDPSIPDILPEADMEARLQKEAEDFVANRPAEPTAEDLFKAPKPEVEAPEVVSKSHKADVQGRVREITQDWKNAPDYEIVQRSDEIADPDLAEAAADPGVLGFYGPDGKVRLIADRIEPDLLPAVVFHESLGHHGMNQMFRDGLDTQLTRMYENGPDGFKARVDDWNARNPDAYADDVNPQARAVEEVFAEMSEAGEALPPKLLDTVKNYMKAVARRLGVTNLKFSEREIATILSMAHQKVIRGADSGARPDGSRFIFIGRKGMTPTERAAGMEAAKYSDGDTGPASEFADTFGLFTGPDGKWRMEIDDSQAGFKNDWMNFPKEGARLEDTLDHPELFERYPELRDYTVRQQEFDSLTAQGYFDPARKTVAISSDSTPEQAFNTLIHEVQHGVQDLERHASGGSPKSALKKANPEQLNRLAADAKIGLEKQLRSAEMDENVFQFLTRGDALRVVRDIWSTFKDRDENYGRASLTSPSWDREMELGNALKQMIAENGGEADTLYRAFDMIRELKTARGQTFADAMADVSQRLEAKVAGAEMRLENISRSRTPDELRLALSQIDSARFQAYENLFGEVEARAVEDRLKMTPEERRDTVPYASQGIDEKDYIVDLSADEQASIKPMRAPKNPDAKEGEPNLAGNINLDNLASNRNIGGILAEAAEGIDRTSVSNDEIARLADDLGLTPAQAAKVKVNYTPAQALALRKAMVQSAENVLRLSRKMTSGQNSDTTRAQFAKAWATHAAIQERVSEVTANAGRLLQQFNIIAEGKDGPLAALKAMRDGNKLLGDEKSLDQLAELVIAHGDNPRAINRLAKATFKPKAEDYIFSLWYNSLLSNPATHGANFVGTGLNFMTDLVEKGLASVLGQPRRWSKNADRVMGREVLARLWGPMAAMKSVGTWKNTWDSFKTGVTGNMVSGKAGEGVSGNLVMPGPLKVLETPTRALSAADEFWRNVISASNIYGLAARAAGKKNLRGKSFWDEVSRLAENPTDDMIAKSLDYTQVIQFLDKPSAIGNWLINLQTPKPKSTVGGRILRGGARVIVPFVRTPDALIRTAIRRSPIGLLERENWTKGLKSGDKAARDQAAARLIGSSALAAFVAIQAQNGNITGSGPEDYKKKQEWMATHQENSIKIGDKYYSVAGLEPLSTNLTAIASMVEKSKYDDPDATVFQKAADYVVDLASTLNENAYTESLGNFFQMFNGSAGQKESAFNNWVAGIASSVTTPAIVRGYNQSYGDPAFRDTTGEGNLESRVQGRVESGYPSNFLGSGRRGSSDLPQKYDVYGRPMEREDRLGVDWFSRVNVKTDTDDPVVRELARLGEAQKSPLVGAPGKNVKVGEETRRLNAQEYQTYQQLSGYWIVETMKQEMADPSWMAMSDEEKVEVVNYVKDDMRKAAREYLFQNSDYELVPE